MFETTVETEEAENNGVQRATNTETAERWEALLGPCPKGRWEGVRRPYDLADVDRLRGSVAIEHTLAVVDVGVEEQVEAARKCREAQEENHSLSLTLISRIG